MLENYFELIGNVSKINEEHITENGKKYKWFDICVNKKYSNNLGKEKNNPTYYKIKIYEKQLEKYSELLVIGRWIKIKGYLNSYIDKNNNYNLNLIAFSLVDMKKEIVTTREPIDKEKSIISYDTDGVMLWNGKRCENKTSNEQEIKEMENLLSEYK